MTTEPSDPLEPTPEQDDQAPDTPEEPTVPEEVAVVETTLADDFEDVANRIVESTVGVLLRARNEGIRPLRTAIRTGGLKIVNALEGFASGLDGGRKDK
jgi:hypothetical protein